MSGDVGSILEKADEIEPDYSASICVCPSEFNRRSPKRDWHTPTGSPSKASHRTRTASRSLSVIFCNFEDKADEKDRSISSQAGIINNERERDILSYQKDPEKVKELREACLEFVSDPNDKMARELMGHTHSSVRWYKRFLEVYGSTKKTANAIQANQEWRQKIGIQKYQEFRVEIGHKHPILFSAMKSLVGYRHGVSKAGRPVKVMQILSELSPKRIRGIYSEDRIFLQELEVLQGKENEHHHFVVIPELIRQKKIPDHYHISIIDLQGVSTKLSKSSLGRNTVKLMLKFDDKHYPDSAIKVFLVNVPNAFGKVWSMIKLVLSKSVTSRIAVITNDLRPLFEVVDQSQLPSCIGGTSPYKLGDHPDS